MKCLASANLSPHPIALDPLRHLFLSLTAGPGYLSVALRTQGLKEIRARIRSHS